MNDVDSMNAGTVLKECEKTLNTMPNTFEKYYTYDTRGNRLSSLTEAYSYNDLNRLVTSSMLTYHYDADGNLVEEKNPLTGETRKYSYDVENRMTGYEHYPTAASPADIAASYKYDLFGRRIQKNVDGVVTNFFWEDDSLAYELDADYKPIRRYVYGAGMDDPEGYVEFSEVDGFVFDESKKGWYTYVKEQVGTVYKVYSDYDKQIVNSRTYDTFGNLIHQTGSSTGKLGFQSKYFDGESGLYYFYHRHYNPANGRFLNEDPIGLNGGLNLYAFVNNNPIKLIDPYGLDFTDEHPGWMKLFCLLWKNTPRYGGYEYGSWLYHGDRGDSRSLWWETGSDPTRRNSCSPKHIPHRSVIAGSCHTHPSGKSRTATRPNDTNVAQEYHPQGKMYIISEYGIWSYDPVTDRDERVLTFRQFRDWCRCNGYW